MRDIRAAVEQLTLTLSLEQRRPRRGRAQDTRQAIALILAHLDRHGATYRHLDSQALRPAGCRGVLTGSPRVAAAVSKGDAKAVAALYDTDSTLTLLSAGPKSYFL